MLSSFLYLCDARRPSRLRPASARSMMVRMKLLSIKGDGADKLSDRGSYSRSLDHSKLMCRGGIVVDIGGQFDE